MSYLYLLFAVVLISIGQILQKAAASRLDVRGGAVAAFELLIRASNFWLAVVAMCAGLVAWLLSLSELDVSRAYPMLAFSFALTTALSAFFLREKVGAYRWLGVGLISIGSVIMMAS